MLCAAVLHARRVLRAWPRQQSPLGGPAGWAQALLARRSGVSATLVIVRVWAQTCMVRRSALPMPASDTVSFLPAAPEPPRSHQPPCAASNAASSSPVLVTKHAVRPAPPSCMQGFKYPGACNGATRAVPSAAPTACEQRRGEGGRHRMRGGAARLGLYALAQGDDGSAPPARRRRGGPCSCSAPGSRPRPRGPCLPHRRWASMPCLQSIVYFRIRVRLLPDRFERLRSDPLHLPPRWEPSDTEDPRSSAGARASAAAPPRRRSRAAPPRRAGARAPRRTCATTMDYKPISHTYRAQKPLMDENGKRRAARPPPEDLRVRRARRGLGRPWGRGFVRARSRMA
jgi:hypothetical protein